MPSYIITSPEGQKFKVNAPDGATQEQVLSYAQQNFASQAPQGPAPKPDVGIGRTALDQGLQGATFGFADEITDRIGALGASLYTGEKYEDVLKDARGASKSRMQAEWEQNPGTSIAANIGGGLLTGGAGATTKTGAAVGNSLRSGNLTARAIKGAAAGATSGAAFGAGSADDGKRLEGAKQGAVLGGVLGGALPVAGALASSAYSGAKTAAQGVAARSPEALKDASDAMRKNAGGIYDQMRQNGATFKPSAVQGFLLPDIDTAISKNNFIAALNPKTIAIVDDLKQKAANGTLGLDELDQYRRMLGRVGASEDGVSAGAARRAIDDFVNNANASTLQNGTKDAFDLLKKGRSEYARASRFDEVSSILIKADGDPNKIKSGLTRFVNNPDNLSGFSKQEVTALKMAARSNVPEKLLKMGGKFGIDLGSSFTPGNTVAPLVGAGFGGPAVPVAGTVARQGQKYLARGKAENVLKTIERGGANASKAIAPISPVLSIPAGGAAGFIGGQQTKPPFPPSVGAPVPASIPGPRSDAPPVNNDMFARVIQAESKGQHFTKNGNPLISPKGAVGIAQIMPKTGPDAAKLAGVEWDPVRFYKDPEYNAALGNAYFNGMKERFNGDDTLALMAYNWGPGNVGKWLKSGADPRRIPKETRDYVNRILG